MVDFFDLTIIPTRAEIKAGIVNIAQNLSPALTVTSWVLGDPSERWIEIAARALDQYLANVTTQAVRAFFFDLNTDPGDPGDLSTDQTPRAGWLSAFMSGWWGVQRGGATYATGSLTVTNIGTGPATFHPNDLTFQRSTAGPDGATPTYRNSADVTVYTGSLSPNSITLVVGATVTIPIIAEQIGSSSNASPTQINIVVTESFGLLSCSNSGPVLGSDREDRANAIARARQQSSAASPNGPSDAYRYASTTGANGDPLQLHDGSGATTVNRVYVSEDSATTDVTIYLANPTGAATTVEVSSANGNINAIPIVNAADGVIYNDPIGVAPDIATLGPTVADAVTGAPGPAPAIEVDVGPIKGAAYIKNVPGLGSVALVAAAQTAIANALTTYFATFPIGGLDQVAGAGLLYNNDLRDTIQRSYPVPVAGQLPAPSLYNVSVTAPAGSTAIPLGNVAALVGPPGISAALDNGAGLIRLTVTSVSGVLVDGNSIQIYDAVTTGGMILNRPWLVDVFDSTHIDLVGSSFVGALVSGAKISLIILQVVP